MACDFKPLMRPRLLFPPSHPIELQRQTGMLNSYTIDIKVPVLSGTDNPAEASLDSTDTTTIVTDVATPAGAWECVIQQSFESGEPVLTIMLKWVPDTAGLSDPDEQAKVYQFLAHFTQLQVVQGLDNVMSMNLRRPAMLLRGVQGNTIVCCLFFVFSFYLTRPRSC